MKKHLHLFAAFLIITSAFAQTPEPPFAPENVLRELPDQRTYFSKTYYNAQNNTYVSRISPGYVHYLASDGRFKDIDTNLKLDKSGAYYVIDSGLYNVAFAAAIGTGNWDVAYEVPRPVQQKFRGPGKPAPVTRLRWKVLSYGYFDQSRNQYQIIDYAKAVTPTVFGSLIRYSQIFNGMEVRYACENIRLKEEIVISQTARNALPDPAKLGLSQNNSYFVVAMEFMLTPNNTKVAAKAANGKAPIDLNNSLAFNGDEPIEFEDETGVVPFFFPKDYAYAVADSVTEFANRVSVKRVFYAEKGKNYLLIGVPWNWINQAPVGDLIIDPTTPVTNSDDVRLYDGANYGTSTILAVGKNPSGGTLKARTLIKFNLSGISSSATVLRATMNLRYYEAVNYGGGTWVDRWVQVHQLLGINFAELEATRDNRTIDLPWNAPYAAINGTDAKASMESTVLFWQSELTELPKWKSWDLTALTQKWLNTPANNYGVILWATNEDVAGYTMRFYSSEADSANRPYLEVVYSTETATKTVYFLKDHLGSIRATVLDSTGAPVIGYDDYDPWGYPLALRTKPIPNAYLQGASKYKFTGMVYDDEYGVNLFHTPFRSYDGLMGRWVVMDPWANNNPGLSPYHYARNNPLTRIDLLGLDDYYYNRKGEQLGVTETDDDDRYFIQDAKGEQSYKDNKYVQFTGNIFNATDAEGGEGKVVAVVAGEDPPTPEDAVTLSAGDQTDNTKDWDFYTIGDQTWKVSNDYHVIITPDGKPKVIYTTGAAKLDVFGIFGPREAYTGGSFFFGLRKRNDEVSWVNDITKRVSERKPELKPFVRSTR